jgi:hypothetical protein
MVDQFEVYEAILRKRGRGWRWCVYSAEGKFVMQGSECTRMAARYAANRGLFLLLLSSSYRSRRRNIPRGSTQLIPDQPD